MKTTDIIVEGRDRPGARMSEKPVYPCSKTRHQILGYRPNRPAPIVLWAGETFVEIQQKLYSSSFAAHCRSEGFIEWRYYREPFKFEN